MSVSVLGDPTLCFHPYTTPSLNAACIRATSVVVLGDRTLCFHPYTTPRIYTACFGATSVSVLGDLSLYRVRTKGGGETLSFFNATVSPLLACRVQLPASGYTEQ